MEQVSAIQAFISVLESGGPYAMAAVLLWLYNRLWTRVEQRDATINDLNTKLNSMIEANTRATTEVNVTLQDLGRKIDKCPK